MEVVVPMPPVLTLQVASHVPVYLNSLEMESTVEVTPVEILSYWQKGIA